MQNGNTLGENWWPLMALGGVLVGLGLVAIALPFAVGVTLSFLLGTLLVLGGLVHGWQLFSARGWRGRTWQGLLAVVYVVAGLSLLVNPIVGLATLTLLLVAYFLIDGVLEVVMGLRLRGERGWGWLLASGVVSLALGWLIWVGWPASSAWAVGLLFGVSLLTSGLAMVGVAMGARRAAERAPTPAEAPGT